MRTTLLILLMALPAGCGTQMTRYQLATNAAGNTVWRLDTWTGDLDACGFESPSKPACWAFPGPTKK